MVDRPVRREVGGRGLRGLSLGCAEAAAPELAFARSGLFEAVDVMDLAAGLLGRQRGMARELGLEWVRYLRQDLEQVRLDPDSYDVIWSIGTIHHVERLERLFGEVNRALTGRGLFLNARVRRAGPAPARRRAGRGGQPRSAGDPEPFRRRGDGTLKESVARVDLAALLADDPSEAIRSSHILQALGEVLEVERVVPTGGTLLMPLLDGIASQIRGLPPRRRTAPRADGARAAPDRRGPPRQRLLLCRCPQTNRRRQEPLKSPRDPGRPSARSPSRPRRVEIPQGIKA